MKKLLLLSAACLLLQVSRSNGQQSAAPPVVYGQTFENANILSPGRLPWLLKNNKEVNDFQLSGYISEVCQKEGCWIKVTTNKTSDDPVFVRFKEHAFTVPKNVAGHRVLINGKITASTQSVAAQKHYLQDAGASQKDIDAVTQPKEVYEIAATGIKVYP